MCSGIGLHLAAEIRSLSPTCSQNQPWPLALSPPHLSALPAGQPVLIAMPVLCPWPSVLTGGHRDHWNFLEAVLECALRLQEICPAGISRGWVSSPLGIYCLFYTVGSRAADSGAHRHLPLQFPECFPMLFFNDPLKDPVRVAPSDIPLAAFAVFLPVLDVLAQHRV